MKTDINFLLEKVLKESVYSIEDIQEAIKTQTPITITQTKDSEDGAVTAQFNVVPISIDQDIITGESDEQGSIEFSLDDVEKINFLGEAGVKVQMDTLGKMDVSKLDKIAQKSDVYITEDEEILTAVKSDLEQPKEEEPEVNLQELALYNVKNWATQLDLELSDVRTFGQNVKEITFEDSERLHTVLIYPDGGIRLSNHLVRNYKDFSNIVEFHRNLL